MVMYSAVFCSVVALLIYGGTNQGGLGYWGPGVRYWQGRRPAGVWRALGFGLGWEGGGPHAAGGAWTLTLRLGWVLSVLTSPCSVSKPSLMLKRLFCSAEMCVMRRFSVWQLGERQESQSEPGREHGRAWGRANRP